MGLRCWFEIMGNCCSCKAGLHLSGVPFAACSLSPQLQHLPAACNFKAEENKDSWELLNNTWRTVLDSAPHTVSGIKRKYLWFPLLLFSTSYLSFTASPPKISTRVLSWLAASLIVYVQSFFPPFFLLLLFFPGSNQEKLWEQRLPISAGEWRSAVWVSTLPFPGSAFTSLIQKESLSSKLADPSAAGVSQAEPLLLCCLFVGHIKWAHVSSGAIWCFHAQICKNLF